jgi:hypothetical protein
MRRRVAVIVGGALMVAIATMLVGHYDGGFERRSGGPLACGDCDRAALGIPVRLDQAASFGSLTLRNPGSRAATLEAVRLLDVDPGFELIDVLVVEPNGTTPLIAVDVGFPPQEPGGATHPVAGYTVEPTKSPEQFVQILVGATITTRGMVGARRMAVDYRVGRMRYRAVYPYSIWLCTHLDIPAGGCTGPAL